MRITADVVAAFRDEKLLAVPAGDNVVRLVPPLIVSEDELREALDKMDSALTALAKAS